MTRLESQIAFVRENFRNDGAEGETVHGLCDTIEQLLDEKKCVEALLAAPTPMLLWCPGCGYRHIDVGKFATKVHHTHACQNCGVVWRPAIVATAGVLFLPGFRDEEEDGE